MTTYKPNTLPKIWWLNPWLHVRRLHAAVGALNLFVCDLDERNTKLICEAHRLKTERNELTKRCNNAWDEATRLKMELDSTKAELDYTEQRRQNLEKEVKAKKPTPKRKSK